MSDTAKPSPNEAASVEEQIQSLRKKAEEGALGDELQDVAGGHTDGIIHVDNPE